jgi:hypothetical protein
VNLISAQARWIAWLTALGILVFLAGLIVQLQDPFGIVYGIPTGLKRWLYLPWILALPTLGVLWYALQLWGEGKARLGARINYTLVFLALAGLYLFLLNWNIFPA